MLLSGIRKMVGDFKGGTWDFRLNVLSNLATILGISMLTTVLKPLVSSAFGVTIVWANVFFTLAGVTLVSGIVYSIFYVLDEILEFRKAGIFLIVIAVFLALWWLAEFGFEWITD